MCKNQQPTSPQVTKCFTASQLKKLWKRWWWHAIFPNMFQQGSCNYIQFFWAVSIQIYMEVWGISLTTIKMTRVRTHFLKPFTTYPPHTYPPKKNKGLVAGLIKGKQRFNTPWSYGRPFLLVRWGGGVRWLTRHDSWMGSPLLGVDPDSALLAGLWDHRQGGFSGASCDLRGTFERWSIWSTK